MKRRILTFKRMPGPKSETHTELGWWRITKGLSYRYLAQVVGVNKNAMLNYCRGKKMPLLVCRVMRALYPDAPIKYDGTQRIYVRALRAVPADRPRLLQETKIEAMIALQVRRFARGKKRLERLSKPSVRRPNKLP